MKDYAAMSDQEINRLVGTLISRDSLSIIASDGNAVIHEYSDCGDFKGICLGWKVFNPCNNPAEAWPIIVENKISLNYMVSESAWCTHVDGLMTDGCWCWDIDPEHYHDHVNPLRAAMIVFLMMKESKND